MNYQVSYPVLFPLNFERITMDLFDASILAKTLISEFVPSYQFAWNSLKRVNGRCVYATRTIYLSRHLTALRTTDSVRLTIMHEIAHAMNPGDGHGKRWKAQMQSWGLPDTRCSEDEVDMSSISNWKAVCWKCSKESYFVRKPRKQRSCGKCDKVYNPKYALNFVRI